MWILEQRAGGQALYEHSYCAARQGACVCVSAPVLSLLSSVVALSVATLSVCVCVCVRVCAAAHRRGACLVSVLTAEEQEKILVLRSAPASKR